MKYEIDTMVLPDGIKLWVRKPFLVENYDELLQLIMAIDILEHQPEAFKEKKTDE